jgi:hypothetical protein
VYRYKITFIKNLSWFQDGFFLFTLFHVEAASASHGSATGQPYAPNPPLRVRVFRYSLG